jgi:hypothetical protein
MVTAAGVAHANRLPVLFLAGDTFASRLPDPVLQQVEHFEDLICIEDHEFLQAVAAGRQYTPGFTEALAYVSVQDAVFRSWESGHWEDVVSLRED